LDEAGARVDRPVEPGGEVVEHYHRFARIAQAQHHVTADIAGAAGDEDGHRVSLGRDVKESRVVMSC
jgi:hypothetical protein